MSCFGCWRRATFRSIRRCASFGVSGAVFAEVVRLARGMGLAGLGRVGGRDEGPGRARKRKAMSYGRMAREERRLQAEIAGLLDEAEANRRIRSPVSSRAPAFDVIAPPSNAALTPTALPPLRWEGARLTLCREQPSVADLVTLLW